MRTADTDEHVESFTCPEDYVCQLSVRKALAVPLYAGELIIGADTVVALEGEILGKPEDAACAQKMLTALSGKSHWVYTGVSLRTAKSHCSFFVKTEVCFYSLSQEEIDAYIATGEPMDKAGAYGVQGRGGLFVREIHGDYFNVVGLPVAELMRQVKQISKV